MYRYRRRLESLESVRRILMPRGRIEGESQFIWYEAAVAHRFVEGKPLARQNRAHPAEMRAEAGARLYRANPLCDSHKHLRLIWPQVGFERPHARALGFPAQLLYHPLPDGWRAPGRRLRPAGG